MLDIEKIAHGMLSDRQESMRFKFYLLEFLCEAYGLRECLFPSDIICYVNAQANTYTYRGQSERNNIIGAIQLSPGRVKERNGKKVTIQKLPDYGDVDLTRCSLLYDSLAFTDVLTNSRVTPDVALTRQLETLSKLRSKPRETLIVSYDRLIDEKFIDGKREKQRWSVKEGELAVAQTVSAVAYLNSQRQRLKGTTLVQSCQGVDDRQYFDCVGKVLPFCRNIDVLGLGGWCILGRQSSYLPIFYKTMNAVIPLIAESGIKRVHIFGVTWYKQRGGSVVAPLPYLLRLCDKYALNLSTDGTSPIGNALWKNIKKSGAEFPYWRHNLAWVKAKLATLRDSECC